jgi:hypothetical protein
MDRRRAIARILRSGGAVAAAAAVPVLARRSGAGGSIRRVRIDDTGIRLRIVKLTPHAIGPGHHLAG